MVVVLNSTTFIPPKTFLHSRRVCAHTFAKKALRVTVAQGDTAFVPSAARLPFQDPLGCHTPLAAPTGRPTFGLS